MLPISSYEKVAWWYFIYLTTLFQLDKLKVTVSITKHLTSFYISFSLSTQSSSHIGEILVKVLCNFKWYNNDPKGDTTRWNLDVPRAGPEFLVPLFSISCEWPWVNHFPWSQTQTSALKNCRVSFPLSLPSSSSSSTPHSSSSSWLRHMCCDTGKSDSHDRCCQPGYLGVSWCVCLILCVRKLRGYVLLGACNRWTCSLQVTKVTLKK